MPAKYTVFGIWDSTIKNFLDSFQEEDYLTEAEFVDLRDWFYSDGADAFHAFYWEAVYTEAKPSLKQLGTYPTYSLYQILGFKTHAFFQMGLKLNEKLQQEIASDLLNTIMMSYNSTTTISVQLQHLFYQLEANILSTLSEFHKKFDPKGAQNYNLQSSKWILDKFLEATINPGKFLKRLPESDERLGELRQQIIQHIDFIKPSPMLTTPSMSSRSLSPRKDISPHVSSRGISQLRVQQGNAGTPPVNVRQLGPRDHTQREISGQSRISTPKSTNSVTGGDPTQLHISTKPPEPKVTRSMAFFADQQRQSSQTLLLGTGNKPSLSPITGSTSGNGSPESELTAYVMTAPGYKT